MADQDLVVEGNDVYCRFKTGPDSYMWIRLGAIDVIGTMAGGEDSTIILKSGVTIRVDAHTPDAIMLELRDHGKDG